MDFQSLLFLIILVLIFVWVFNRKEAPKYNYCLDCQRPAKVRRRVGVGSILTSVFTLGIWYVVVIPFYKKRCFICGGSNVSQGEAIMMEERKLKEIRLQEEALDDLVRQRRNIAR